MMWVVTQGAPVVARQVASCRIPVGDDKGSPRCELPCQLGCRFHSITFEHDFGIIEGLYAGP